MADLQHPPPDESQTDDERSALQTFERILEIMPDDRGALEAAILAAHACDEHETALLHRIHLADILFSENELDALNEHVDLLRSDDDPRAKAWIEAFDKGERLSADARLADASVPPLESIRSDKAAPRSAFNISDEIDLAWKLFEHHEISQEEYAGLVRDLTEMSASHNSGTVSVLHALEANHNKNHDAILSFLAQEAEEAGTPFISLSCFTMRPELAQMLPEPFMVNRGALVFETLGRERLVALLNPFNQSLRADVQQLCGTPCHFYLAKASEFDDAVLRLRQSVGGPG